MIRTPWFLGCMICVLGLMAPALPGQTPVRDTAPPAADADTLKIELGPVYESQTGGIALRPPAGSKQIARGADPDLIVEFINDDKQWALKVHRNTFSRPMQLSNDQGALDQRGILELTASAFTAGQVSVEVLRQDVVNQGALDVGMLAMRYGPRGQRKLAQQAIIRASDRVFYTLTFNSRSAVPPPDGDGPDQRPVDPQEREAVLTFNAILDTVRLLDRAHIKQEQDARLRRTQALMINFHERKLTEVAQKEQWLRLVRDGRDIGYMYVIEEPYVYGSDNGLLVLVRSRSMPDKDVTVDAASSLWVSYDRKQEYWVSSAIVNDGRPKSTKVSETGISYQRIKNVRMPAPDPAAGQRADRNLIMKQVPEYLLTVERTISGTEGKPVVRELPPGQYLPQALGHLLPRLLPLNEPQGYLFVSWISDRQELMFRYVDVELDQEVEIDGRRVRAVPVTDRIGLEGSPTTHYMSMDGKYLGSKSETLDGQGNTVVSWILPTDARTLQELWKDAQLTRPETATPDRKPNGADRR